MRRFAALLAVGVPLFLVAACRSTTPPAGPEYKMTTTIKDIMDSMVDKSADVIWDSVATIVTRLCASGPASASAVDENEEAWVALSRRR